MFYDPDGGGKAANAHVGVIGAADRPLRLAAVEAALNGRAVDEAAIAAAVSAATCAVDPPDDIHASAAYRQSLIGAMVERALRGVRSMFHDWVRCRFWPDQARGTHFRR